MSQSNRLARINRGPAAYGLNAELGQKFMDTLDQHLRQSIRDCAPGAKIRKLEQVPWASVTFRGERVTFEVVISAADTERLTAIEEYEFAIPGWLIADAAVILDGFQPARATVEFLALAEDHPSDGSQLAAEGMI